MSDSKQNLIVDAAIKVFARSGSSTKLNEIAKEANITEATFYRIGQSRENVLVLMYERFWRKIYEEIKSIQDNPLQENSIKKIETMIHLIIQFFLRETDLVKAIIRNQLPLPEDLPSELVEKRLEVRSCHRLVLGIVDSIIEAGQKSNEITNDISPQVARQILMGGVMMLLYGLFISFGEEEPVAYSRNDIIKGIDFILKMISKKES